MKSSARKLLAFSCLAISLVAACSPEGEGLDPPQGKIYFPVGLLVGSEGRFLYIVNSDFDLQYNRGTVQSIRLGRVRELARIPCSEHGDCPRGQHCDLLPGSENAGAPSHVCVDDEGPDQNEPCGPFSPSEPEPCASDSSRVVRGHLSPGRCGAICLEAPQDDGPSLIHDVVGISAFATAGLLTSGPEEAERIFIPVRGDSTLHYIDVEEGRFACDQGDEGLGRCGENFRISTAPEWIQDLQPLPHEDDLDQTIEPLEVAPEPFELAAGANGRLLVLTHQVGGRASVFVNDWKGEPFLAAELEGLPPNPIGIAALPPPKLASVSGRTYQAGFLTTFRTTSQVQLLRFFDDGILGSDPFASSDEPFDLDRSARPAIRMAASENITTNSTGFDSRGILIDDHERSLAQAQCAPDDVECLALSARVPLDVYVANRSPNSLLVGKTDAKEAPIGASELPTFHDNIPLTAGPSRVVMGHIVNPEGKRERRIFVLCFDSALIYVYDPERGRLEGEIRTGRGPHSLAFDPKRPLLYVGHFTDSYVGVMSLDQRYPHTYGTTLATLGVPTPPRAAK